jgi:hypothetical protein
MLGTLVVTLSVRHTCGLSSSVFVGVRGTQPLSEIRTGMSEATTTWNSFGERASPPFKHFLHQLMSSEFSTNVSRVTSSLPVDAISAMGVE